jgi:Family of unknown function (DUF6496)
MASKYSKSTQENVHQEMHEMKEGKLKSGRSGKKVTNPKQAIAIGLSEARSEGKKVPPAPKAASKKSTTKKTATKKTANKKSTATKKSPAKKSTVKKAIPKKTATKKSVAKKSSKS